MRQDLGSLPEMFLARVAETPDALAYQYPSADDRGWESVTWKQTAERVRAVACGLLSAGLASEQRCAILASTRFEWILADLAILCAGGAATTVYPSNTPAECQYILGDSAARFVFAEDDEQVAKLLEVRSELTGVDKVITIDGEPGHDGWVITLEQLAELGQRWDADNPGKFHERVDSIAPDHLATLIYTSGTTGRPKGVELLHECWAYAGAATAKLDILTPNDVQYLWLPLSHSFGKVLEATQIQVGFPTAIDGRIPKLIENLAVIRPTFVAAAPRIFEKVYNKIVQGVEDKGGIALALFRWSLSVGREVSKLRQQGREPGAWLSLELLVADKLVFSKIKNRFGGRIRFFISGSAPLSLEMAEFFHAAGVLILEGYGLTESSAASVVNRPDTFKFGTVGLPLPGTEIRIARDGEVLLRSPGIMRGYRNMPEATAETIDGDGWLLTGDIGELDELGRLRITDRKKDLIKTSGGKYVAPQKLEGRLKSLCPYLSQVLVHGNRRNYCTALVTLDEEGIASWAEDNGLAGKSPAEVAASDQARAMVQAAVDRLNVDLPPYETIKKFAIVSSDWSVESGELTASLKVKRKVVETKFADMLDAFYEDAVRRVE